MQINEVTCDVSYKFLWSALEINGKNLPDAKLGANGDGSKHVFKSDEKRSIGIQD